MSPLSDYKRGKIPESECFRRAMLRADIKGYSDGSLVDDGLVSNYMDAPKPPACVG